MQSVESNVEESKFNESKINESNFKEGVVHVEAVRRRRFIGSALTLGAGAAIGGSISFPSAGGVLAAEASNSVETEFLRQLHDGVRRLRGDKPGEAARKVASATRFLAAYYRGNGTDAAFTRRIQVLVRREGRSAFLRKEVDASMLTGELKKYGFAGPYLPEPADPARRSRVLAEMESKGVTGLMETAAAEFERLAAYLDARPALAPVAWRQQCPDLRAQLLFIEFIAAAACMVNPIFCAVFAGLLAGLKIALYMTGC
jgi:hypothetical protein